MFPTRMKFTDEEKAAVRAWFTNISVGYELYPDACSSSDLTFCCYSSGIGDVTEARFREYALSFGYDDGTFYANSKRRRE